MTTGAEFYTFVLQTFKRTDKSVEFFKALNNVLREMRRRHNFNENRVEAYTTGIAALGEYLMDLPSNFGTVIGDLVLSEAGSDYYPLRKLNKDEFDRLYPNPTSTNAYTGQPQHFCIYANKIIIGPVPDKITYLYTLNYATKLVTEVTATSTMPFDDFEEGLKDGVLRNLYADLEDDANAIKWSNLFEKNLAEYIAQDIENTRAARLVGYCGI